MAANLDQTYGAAMIGLLFATFFQGVLTVQAYTYYEAFPGDSWRLKLLVAGVWMLDTLHLYLIAQSVYHYLVTEWGNTSELMKPSWEFGMQLAIVGLASVVCKLFLLHRIWVFSNRNKILTLILGCMCLASFGLDLGITAKNVQTHATTQRDRHGAGPFGAPTSQAIASLCLGATGDIILAFCLCYYLQTGRGGLERTDSVISRIMQYTIATGLLTSLYAFACVITYFTIPHTFIFIGMQFSQGRLYTNALLVTLNFRRNLRASLNTTNLDSLPEGKSESLAFRSRSTATRTSSENNEQGPSAASPHNVKPGVVFGLEEGITLKTHRDTA